MINGKFNAKDMADSLLKYITLGLVKLRFTANMVTITGLLLVFAASGLYMATHNRLLFSVLLAFSFIFDALDGSVARLTGTTSRTGAYMDAVFDRYQETAVYFAIGFTDGLWVPAAAALSGALLVPYNKARAAFEIHVENDRWPDLMERTERVSFIVVGVIASHYVTRFDLLYYWLIAAALLFHFTAAQRFVRAIRLINGSGKR